jgi:hypothetical protein
MPDNTISIRVPAQKALIFGVSMPDGALTEGTAHDGSDLSRVGYHIDCFLNNEAYSTFYYDVDNQWEYYYRDTLYTINGGETCSDNAELTNCANALGALEDEHWTYLHLNYHPDAVQRWRDEGCFDEISLRLGYRLALINGTFSERISHGGPFSLAFTVENSGFAAPVNSRIVEVIFRNQSNGVETSHVISEDPRFWLPAERTTVEADIPVSLEPGRYDVFLNLPDPSTSLRNDPRYSIQLANDGLWEAATGYNSLLLTLDVI